MSAQEVLNTLNKKAGYWLVRISNDMRDVEVAV
jgi:acetate kinase